MTPTPCDFAVMGEVLEHVDSPGLLLNKLSKCLTPTGKLLLTTCANCAAIDHVFLFRSINHIRSLLTKAGFNILDDIALPVIHVNNEGWHDLETPANYGAILCRKR